MNRGSSWSSPIQLRPQVRDWEVIFSLQCLPFSILPPASLLINSLSLESLLRERDGASGESGYVMMSEVVKVANRESERERNSKQALCEHARKRECVSESERERERAVRSFMHKL